MPHTARTTQLFQKFDADGTNCIDRAEFALICSAYDDEMGEEDIDAMLAEAGAVDGKLDYAAFHNWIIFLYGDRDDAAFEEGCRELESVYDNNTCDGCST
jgi:hypothetical protein